MGTIVTIGITLSLAIVLNTQSGLQLMPAGPCFEALEATGATSQTGWSPAYSRKLPHLQFPATVVASLLVLLLLMVSFSCPTPPVTTMAPSKLLRVVLSHVSPSHAGS